MRLSHWSPHVSAGPGPHCQRGVTIVEAAFVLPVFFMMVLGFIDVGFGVFQTSQATGAAADGARAGILWEDDSPDEEAIEEAVHGRLAGQDVEDIDITCLASDRTEVTCPSVDADTGFLRVEVSWPYTPLSFVGAAFPDQDITGSATMALVRQPTSSSDADDGD